MNNNGVKSAYCDGMRSKVKSGHMPSEQVSVSESPYKNNPSKYQGITFLIPRNCSKSQGKSKLECRYLNSQTQEEFDVF